MAERMRTAVESTRRVRLLTDLLSWLTIAVIAAFAIYLWFNGSDRPFLYLTLATLPVLIVMTIRQHHIYTKQLKALEAEEASSDPAGPIVH